MYVQTTTDPPAKREQQIAYTYATRVGLCPSRRLAGSQSDTVFVAAGPRS